MNTQEERRDFPESDAHPQGAEEQVPADVVEFVDNPEPRCACVLLLDKSLSMSDNGAIDALNDGIRTFKTELEKDTLASLRVEVAIVTFGGGVELVQDFVTVDGFDPPALKADGGATQMAGGIQMALDIVEGRKQQYKKTGIGYYRPWIFMITDGEPTGETEEMVRDASERLAKEEKGRAVVFFAVGVEGANMELLRQMIPRQPLPLKGLAFRELFKWVSVSMARVSRSGTDDEVQLDLSTLTDWAKI